MGQIQPVPEVKFSGTRLWSFIYLPLLASFALQQQNGAVATETVWPAKLKIFVIWPFAEKVCQLLA
jgi:hypothetical protein